MRDSARTSHPPGIDLVAEPACCRGGACGPIFETPLLELAFNRIRDMVRSRNAPTLVEAGPVTSPLDEILSTAPAVPAPTAHPSKDAPHD
jgi:hypothetical protein